MKTDVGTILLVASLSPASNKDLCRANHTNLYDRIGINDDILGVASGKISFEGSTDSIGKITHISSDRRHHVLHIVLLYCAILVEMAVDDSDRIGGVAGIGFVKSNIGVCFILRPDDCHPLHICGEVHEEIHVVGGNGAVYGQLAS